MRDIIDIESEEHSRTNLYTDSLNSSYLLLTGWGAGAGGVDSISQYGVNVLMKIKLKTFK